jgi:hypothetical protein
MFGANGRVIDVDGYPRLLAAHAGGSSLRRIASRLGVSHETARRLIAREAEEMADSLEADLLAAWERERGGFPEVAWPTFVVAARDPDWRELLSLLMWSVDELRSRGIDVHVQTASSAQGGVFQLTLEEEKS